MNTHTTQTTHCFTLQQLRAATQAGGVAGVSLKAQGSGFYIQIQLRTGQHAVLVTARSRSPRMFKNPAQSFGVLKRVGIVTGSFDVTHYAPEQQPTNDTKQKEKVSAPKVTKAPRAKKAPVVTPTPVAASTPSAATQPAVAPTIPAPALAVTPKPKPSPEPAPSVLNEPEKNDLSLGIQQSLI